MVDVDVKVVAGIRVIDHVELDPVPEYYRTGAFTAWNGNRYNGDSFWEWYQEELEPLGLVLAMPQEDEVGGVLGVDLSHGSDYMVREVTFTEGDLNQARELLASIGIEDPLVRVYAISRMSW